MSSLKSTKDNLINSFDNFLRTVFLKPHATKDYPGKDLEKVNLSKKETALSSSLMRVNHVGEVCAQALYAAQALTTKDPILRGKFIEAGKDEENHLSWTRQRLDSLGARTSLLNPLWYIGAFGLGLLAGSLGDKTSLGFVVETENQVEDHLQDHINRLPSKDIESLAVVLQMKLDEIRHGKEAYTLGAKELPNFVKYLMKASSKIMTTIAHRI